MDETSSVTMYFRLAGVTTSSLRPIYLVLVKAMAGHFICGASSPLVFCQPTLTSWFPPSFLAAWPGRLLSAPSSPTITSVRFIAWKTSYRPPVALYGSSAEPKYLLTPRRLNLKRHRNMLKIRQTMTKNPSRKAQLELHKRLTFPQLHNSQRWSVACYPASLTRSQRILYSPIIAYGLRTVSTRSTGTNNSSSSPPIFPTSLGRSPSPWFYASHTGRFNYGRAHHRVPWIRTSLRTGCSRRVSAQTTPEEATGSPAGVAKHATSIFTLIYRFPGIRPHRRTGQSSGASEGLA